MKGAKEGTKKSETGRRRWQSRAEKRWRALVAADDGHAHLGRVAGDGLLNPRLV